MSNHHYINKIIAKTQDPNARSAMAMLLSEVQSLRTTVERLTSKIEPPLKQTFANAITGAMNGQEEENRSE
jgi:hypothetical protein